MDDAPSILQSKSSDIKIDAKVPELKIVTIEKPTQSEKSIIFKKKIKGELISDTKSDVIINPLEVENPPTGEVIKIETPVEDKRDVLPIIIETPTGGSGGGFGGGGFTEVERGDNRIGRDRIYEGGGRENIQ